MAICEAHTHTYQDISTVDETLLDVYRHEAPLRENQVNYRECRDAEDPPPNVRRRMSAAEYPPLKIRAEDGAILQMLQDSRLVIC